MNDNPVPEIDKNAPLALDSVEVEEVALPEEEKRGLRFYWIGTLVMILFVLGVVITSKHYFWPTQQEVKSVALEVEPTPVVTEAMKPALDKSVVIFEVLNATGKSGEASRIKAKLESAGYKVVAIGNSKEDKNGMGLYLSSKLLPIKDLLVEDLKNTLANVVYVSELNEGTASARVIIGL